MLNNFDGLIVYALRNIPVFLWYTGSTGCLGHYTFGYTVYLQRNECNTFKMVFLLLGDD